MSTTEEPMREMLLFAAHGGQYRGHSAAIIMQGHCLPIACSVRDDGGASENGIHACWQATSDAETFFEHLGIEAIQAPSNRTKLPAGWQPEGLYVYEVEYGEGEVNADDGEDWSHLAGGTLRRPTAEELEPLTRGLAPWGGVVL